MIDATPEAAIMPRYPVYIPSKGRWDIRAKTARCLRRDGVPFQLVVEPQEADAYKRAFGEQRVLVLPFRDRGSSTPARNWIKQHATEAGHVRHWQIDDNIQRFYRVMGWKRIPCRAGIGLRVCEDFTDRYTNVAISGLAYTFFVVPVSSPPPFFRNVHVYSCTLVLNDTPFLWRPQYNEDTDLCLQVLSAGWCTILLNAFCIQKLRTMTLTGGNTDGLYAGDGRLKMARSLQRDWGPHVVEIKRKFQRPQHHIKGSWRAFDTPLQLRADYVPPTEAVNEYGMTLKTWDRRDIIAEASAAASATRRERKGEPVAAGAPPEAVDNTPEADTTAPRADAGPES